MPDSQSRESEKQIITLQKDNEHLKYVIDELEKECEFVKTHFTTKNSERIDDIKMIHDRIDAHQKTDLEFHENVRKKISQKFDTLDCKIRKLERWKWAVWGGLVVFGCMIGYFIPGVKGPGISLL
jgi:dynactin complex subunit